MSIPSLLRLLNSTVTESIPVTRSAYVYVLPTGGVGINVGVVVVPQPEAVQPGQVGEVPIESQ